MVPSNICLWYIRQDKKLSSALKMFDDKTFEKYRPLEEVKCRNYAFVKRSYYDAPDGEDIIGKLMSVSRWSIFSGMLYGSALVLNKPYCRTYGQMMYRLLKPTLPLLAMSYAFTTTTYAATNIRKADDELNYAIGAAAVSIVIGYLKGVPMGVLTSIFGVPSAALYKHDKMVGKTIPVKKHISPYWRNKLDFTLSPEREGNWKKEMPPQ